MSKFLLLAVAALSLVAGPLGRPCAAPAEVRFTTPVPPFAQALATAKQAGKMLVVEISATWCEPCKDLAKDLEQAAAKPVLAPLHLVVYDGFADDTGMAVKEKLKVVAFPTLVAFDGSGQEVARTQGYDGWRELEGWLREIPLRAIPLDQALARADAAPTNGTLQLDVGQRLLKDKQYEPARRYFTRAQKAGPPATAATAAWKLLQLDHREQVQKLGQAQAVQLAGKYPGTPEAGAALDYLATLPTPPLAALEPLLLKHLAALTDASRINALAYTAMRAGAMKAAVQSAQRLSALASEKSAYLDTLAEVAFYAEAKLDKALTLSERAMAAAGSDAERAIYKHNQDRFRRNKKEPSDALATIAAPALTISETPPALAPLPQPPWVAMMMKLEKLLKTDCAQQAPASYAPLRVLVLAAAKPGAHRLMFAPGTPPAWAACATQAIQAAELTPGVAVDMTVRGLPASFELLLSQAKQAAEADCAKLATSRELMLVLSGEAGQPPVLSLPPVDSSTPGLRACLEKALASLKPPRALLQTVTLHFKAQTTDGPLAR